VHEKSDSTDLFRIRRAEESSPFGSTPLDYSAELGIEERVKEEASIV
jgi:hypothetical protein